MNTQPNWAGGSYPGEQGVDSTRARPARAEAELLDDLVPADREKPTEEPSAPVDLQSRRGKTRDVKEDQSASPLESSSDEASDVVPPKPARKPKRKAEAAMSGTLDDLMRTVEPEETGPAETGLRGGLNKVSFGLAKAKPSKNEMELRQDRKAIRAEWSRLMTWSVGDPKGNSGKSLTMAMVSATLGQERGGGVLAIDGNEAMGTMALTAEKGRYDLTITEALRDAHRFESGEAHRGEWAQYVRQQSSHFDILAADEEPSRMMMIGDEEIERIHAIARRYYSIIGCDTGNITRTSAWNAIIATTDQLVVPVDLGLKTSVSAYRMFDQLAAQGREDLVKNAIIVVTGHLGASDGKRAAERRDALAHRARSVVEIPFDKALTTDRPSITELSTTTKRAYLRLAAEIARGFSAIDPGYREQSTRH